MGDWWRTVTNTPFGQAVLTANALAAVISALATLISVGISLAWKRKLLQKVQEQKFQTVLSSDDILSVGKYLDDNLGAIAISAYVQDRAIASRFDHLFARLSDYVGTTEGMREEEAVSPPLGTTSAPPVVPEIQPVIHELETGERWNALARLRRLLELRLREYLASRGVPDDKIRSAGQMVRFALQHQLLDESLAHQLRYAIGVANRAVHGEEVSEAEAQEAVGIAQYALDSIGRLSRPIA